MKYDRKFLGEVVNFMGLGRCRIDLTKFDDKSLFVFYKVIFSKALVKFGRNNWGQFSKRMDKRARFQDFFFDGIGERSLLFLYGYSNKSIYNRGSKWYSELIEKQCDLEGLAEVLENCVLGKEVGGIRRKVERKSKVSEVIFKKADIVQGYKGKEDVSKLLKVLENNMDKIRIVRKEIKEVVLEEGLFSSSQGILEKMILEK